MTTRGELEVRTGGLRFGQNWVLRNVGIRIPHGARCGIIGRSGVGKSTLVRVLAGFGRLNEGKVTLDGKMVNGPGHGVALVFQNGQCFPWLTALANVKFAIRNRSSNHDSSASSELEAISLLDLVGLKSFAKYRPHQLSGGMVQRLAVARALGSRPSVLILDEAFSALDPFTRDEVRAVVKAACTELDITLCVVSHDLEDIASLCERVIVLHGKPARATEIELGEQHSVARLRETYWNVENSTRAQMGKYNSSG